MQNELIEVAAFLASAAGSIIAFVQRNVVIGLTAAAVALLAFAAAIEAL